MGVGFIKLSAKFVVFALINNRTRHVPASSDFYCDLRHTEIAIESIRSCLDPQIEV